MVMTASQKMSDLATEANAPGQVAPAFAHSLSDSRSQNLSSSVIGRSAGYRANADARTSGIAITSRRRESSLRPTGTASCSAVELRTRTRYDLRTFGGRRFEQAGWGGRYLRGVGKDAAADEGRNICVLGLCQLAKPLLLLARTAQFDYFLACFHVETVAIPLVGFDGLAIGTARAQDFLFGGAREKPWGDDLYPAGISWRTAAGFAVEWAHSWTIHSRRPTLTTKPR